MAYIHDSRIKHPWLNYRLEDLFNEVMVGRVMEVVRAAWGVDKPNPDKYGNVVGFYLNLANLLEYSTYYKENHDPHTHRFH